MLHVKKMYIKQETYFESNIRAFITVVSMAAIGAESGNTALWTCANHIVVTNHRSAGPLVAVVDGGLGGLVE